MGHIENVRFKKMFLYELIHTNEIHSKIICYIKVFGEISLYNVRTILVKC